MTPVQENFSFIRFAEYRPQTFTSDLTLEIPTLAQFIKDETYQPVNVEIYLELTSVAIKNVRTICKRIEEVVAILINVGKDNFRSFPPIEESFSLTLNLLKYSSGSKSIQSVKTVKSYNQMQHVLFKGLGRDLEKWILVMYAAAEQESDYNPSKWNLLQALNFVKEEANKNIIPQIKKIHLLFLSCWNTESKFEDAMQSLEPFDQTQVSWYYLFTISPLNSMTTAIADLLNVSVLNLLIEEKNLSNLQLTWKNIVSTLIEPILEVTVNPTAIGSKYSVATNMTLIQNQKHFKNKLVIYNIRSQRYPLRVNLLFNLPVQEQKNSGETDPVVLESLELKLKTSTGEEFSQEILKECRTYRLPAGESMYQPERELNNRMRRGERLKGKLQSILQQQSELNAQIKKMIVEPNYLQDMVDEEAIQESIENLKVAFEIVNYLQEQELLLAEMPPTSKMFKPPENNNNSLI